MGARSSSLRQDSPNLPTGLQVHRIQCRAITTQWVASDTTPMIHEWIPVRPTSMDGPCYRLEDRVQGSEPPQTSGPVMWDQIPEDRSSARRMPTCSLEFVRRSDGSVAGA